MNIFEALAKGDGRATLPEYAGRSFALKKIEELYCKTQGMYFVWLTKDGKYIENVSNYELTRNNWTPYVPEKSVSFMDNNTFERASAYQVAYHKLKEINISEDTINKILIPPEKTPSLQKKTKHSRVFKDIEIINLRAAGGLHNIYVPNFPDNGDLNRFKALYGKPPVTITVEWEE